MQSCDCEVWEVLWGWDTCEHGVGVGTEGCKLKGSCGGGCAAGVHRGSTRSTETRGDEDTIGGCDYILCPVPARATGAGGYRQGWWQVPVSVLSGDFFYHLKDLLGTVLFLAPPWLWGE